MKRFYKTAEAKPAADGAVILLDGRLLKTPAKAEFRLPSLALAEAIAAEWAAQGETIKPQEMPLMRLAATALDRVAPNRAPATEEVIRYSGSDLLAYRAEAPADLVARQQAEWQPLLDWFRERYDITMQVTQGIIAIAQPADLPGRMLRICEGLDSWRLTALHTATTVCGSVVVALALLERRLDAENAYQAAFLDELHQARLWGEDDEAMQRREELRSDLAALERFLALLD